MTDIGDFPGSYWETGSAACRCLKPTACGNDQGEGATAGCPGIVNFSDLVADSLGVARIVLEANQDMLLRAALQTARDDYETMRDRQREGIEIAKRAVKYSGRAADAAQHRRIIS